MSTEIANNNLIPFEVNGKWGYAGQNFDIIIFPQYDWVDFFNEGDAAVKISQKYTYIDVQNNKFFDCIYDYAFPYKFGLGILYLNKKYTIVNSTRSILINCTFDDFPTITEEFIFGINRNGTTYFNHLGEELFHLPSVDYSGLFFEDKAVVAKSFRTAHSKYGVINSKGRFVIEMVYDNISEFNENIAIVKKNEKYGLIDGEGRQVTPIYFEDIDFYSWGNVTGFQIIEDRIIAKKHGKYGFISKNGKELIPFRYDLVTRFMEGISIIKSQDMYGAIDFHGNEVIPNIYDYLDTEYSYARNDNSKVLVAKLNRLNGVLDFNGKEIIKLSDWKIGNFYVPFATITIGEKSGIINNKGEFTVAPTFDSVSICTKELAIVSNGKYGLLSTSGRVIIPCSFFSIEKLNRLDYFKIKIEKDGPSFYCDFYGRIHYPKLIKQVI